MTSPPRPVTSKPASPSGSSSSPSTLRRQSRASARRPPSLARPVRAHHGRGLGVSAAYQRNAQAPPLDPRRTTQAARARSWPLGPHSRLSQEGPDSASRRDRRGLTDIPLRREQSRARAECSLLFPANAEASDSWRDGVESVAAVEEQERGPPMSYSERVIASPAIALPSHSYSTFGLFGADGEGADGLGAAGGPAPGGGLTA